MSQPLLDGEVEYIDDPGPDPVEMLRAEVAELRDELSAIKSIMLRQYGAYRQAFGEQSTVVSSDGADKWNAIKQRLAPRQREAIEILLLQGSMKRTQLAAAMKMDYSNCTKNVVGILLRQGWLIDNGGNLSLKQL